MYRLDPNSPNVLRVPVGMSYVNAFYAIYTSGGIQSDYFLTCEKVAELFRETLESWGYQSVLTIDYFQGTPIKANFIDFPLISVSPANKERTQLALQRYSQIPSMNRFDENDSYSFDPLAAIRDSGAARYETEQFFKKICILL